MACPKSREKGSKLPKTPISLRLNANACILASSTDIK